MDPERLLKMIQWTYIKKTQRTNQTKKNPTNYESAPVLRKMLKSWFTKWTVYFVNVVTQIAWHDFVYYTIPQTEHIFLLSLKHDTCILTSSVTILPWKWVWGPFSRLFYTFCMPKACKRVVLHATQSYMLHMPPTNQQNLIFLNFHLNCGNSSLTFSCATTQLIC